MFIIWGTETKNKVLGNLKEMNHCEYCNNTSSFEVIRYMKWFTIYWIPLFPISIKYYICCPNCNYGKQIKKVELAKLREES